MVGGRSGGGGGSGDGFWGSVIGLEVVAAVIGSV